MGYRQRRLPIHYSQNFLKSRSLIKKLIRLSSIGPNDTVLEIGSGNGIITSQLLKESKRVVAVEKDRKAYYHLRNNLKNSRLNLVNADFLKFNLPRHPYKVFANIPFFITTEIVKKLTNDRNFQEGYLVMQKEAAQKFIGMPYAARNSMAATLLKPWFDLSLFWKFEKEDFIPSPNVDVVMIRITRRSEPSINTNLKELFSSFVIYSYSRSKMAKLTTLQMLSQFNLFNKTFDKSEKDKIIRDSERYVASQNNIQKNHRTRNDKNWLNK